MSSTETITWAPASSPPDADLTVQLFNRDASEPVWLGWYDGGRWWYVDGNPAEPTHWADMCVGPKP